MNDWGDYNWWEHGDYTGAACKNCGRERVILATSPDGSERPVCEKCGWDEMADDYARTLDFPASPAKAEPKP